MQDCTCIGTCKGRDGLGENWRCVLEPAAQKEKRLIPVPRGMCDAFYKIMSAGGNRRDDGTIMMLADDAALDKFKQ